MAITWNPSDKDADVTLSNGDLTAAGGGQGSVRATESKSSGKWYWEFKIDTLHTYIRIGGVATSSFSINNVPGLNDAYSYGYYTNGRTYFNGVYTAVKSIYALNDIIGVALDLDNGKIWWSKNNSWINGGDPAAGTSEDYSGVSGTFFPVTGWAGSGGQITARFADGDLSYNPPSGFSVLDEPICLFDGKLSINSPTDLLDGKAKVIYKATNLLDGKVKVKDVATDLLDGKAKIKDSVIKLLDGKAVLKDTTTNLLDGKAIIEGLSYSYLDGKVWIKEAIEGSIELPFLDILGNTGAVGNVILPFFEVLGEGSVGVDAQGNITLPGLGVVGFTGAKCSYDLPSLGISGTSVVGTVGSGNVILSMLTIEGQSFTDAIVNGDVTLPTLRVNASSIHGSLCIGEVSLPSLGIAATAKVGVVCTGAVTLPCLVIEAKGGHLSIGDGDVVLPLLQIYSTASILADPRDGCHILRHHRWR